MKQLIISFLLLSILDTGYAQKSDTAVNGAQNCDTIVYFANKTLALKKQNDTVFFYNSSGDLRKMIDLKNKKVTHFGLPKEVQDIIYTGMVPERLEIMEETFPTYLYTQKYTDAGIVLCKERVFYNELGLKTGYEEICPNDIADGSDYHFGGKNIYKYNKYGLPTQIDNIIYEYNDNGQLIEVYYKEKSSGEKRWSRKYKYKDNKLSELKTINSLYPSVRYKYNDKGLLSDIIKNQHFKTSLEYDDNNRVISVSKVVSFNEIKKTPVLIYTYDNHDRIVKIQAKNKRFYYTYDDNGNLVERIQKGYDRDIVDHYRYDENGTLIYIQNRWGEDKGYLKY